MSQSGSDHDDTYIPPPATDVGSSSRRKISTRLGRRRQPARVVVSGGRYLPPPGSEGASSSAEHVIPEGTEGLAPTDVDSEGIRTFHLNQEVLRFTPDGRLIVETAGDSFLPSKATATAITKTIKENFSKGWKNWTAVRKDEAAIGAMLRSFLEKCTWLPEQQKEVERVFHKRCSHRYSELLREARNKNVKPPYMGDSSWNELNEYWGTPEYRAYCEKAKKNRASERGGCTHTGGSVNAATHHRRLEARYNRPVTLPELHEYLTVREDTGEYITPRAANIQETYRHEMSQRHEQSSGTDTDHAEEARAAREIWERAVGPQKSNRMVGSGGIGPTAFRTSIIPSLSSSHSAESTGRSYVPNASELNAVTQLTQQLSEAHRQFAERQEQSDRQVQMLEERARLAEERMEARLAEERRLSEERFKLLQDQLMMSQHSRPSYPPQQHHAGSSSQMPPASYPPQQHYGGGFQPWVMPQYSQQYPPPTYSQYPPYQPYQPPPQQSYQPPPQQSPQQQLSQQYQHPHQQSPQQQLESHQSPQLNLNIDLNNLDGISAFLAFDADTYYNQSDDSGQHPPQ